MSTEKKATRKSFGEALADLGEKYPQVVCLDADLSKSTMSCLFAKKFPDRFFEMGIQEANMIGTGAGLSFMGKVPFICSFGAFVTGRFDQIRMSIGYSGANVKIVGTHCGVGIGPDGHSQMGLEDIALMRTIPNMTVLQPAYDKEAREMVEWAINHQGPVYLRLTRQDLKSYTQDMEFEPGIYPCFHSGHNVALLACGALLETALKASQIHASKTDHAVGVYNASTSKPLNENHLRELTKDYDTFVVLEDHSIHGGTGTAIAEWMSEHAPGKQVIRYGVKDVFGESGTPEDLYKKHKFTVDDVYETIENLCQ